MTIEFFSRREQIPRSTVHRVVREAATPASVGVEWSTKGGRRVSHVFDPGRLLDAYRRHVGSGAIPPVSVLRLSALTEAALSLGFVPPSVPRSERAVWCDGLREDASTLRSLLPGRRAA